MTPQKARPAAFIKNYHEYVKGHFKGAENANILFSFLTGEKQGITPRTKKDLTRLNLIFLLSPSGFHLSGLLLLLSFGLKKWRRRMMRFSVFGLIFLFGPTHALVRSSLLRSLASLNFIFKTKLTIESLFFLVFLLSFFIGHYHKNPLSFLYSFAFLGTFLALRDYPKITLVLGLYATQLTINLFMGQSVSLLSIPIGLLLAGVFSLLFPLVLVFLLSFWAIPINWIEPVIRQSILFARKLSLFIHGSFTSSSIFLLAAVLCLLTLPRGKPKLISFAILLYLHTNTAKAPPLFLFK